VFVGILLFTFSVFFHGQEDFPVLKGPYLGQKPPGKKPEIFAPGIISADATQGYPSISKDGKEFYFNDRRRGGWMVTMCKNNIWQAPKSIPFSKQYGFVEAIVSYNGSELFFCSKHPHDKSDKSVDLDLWVMKREKDEWQVPVKLNPTLNSDNHEAFATMATSGNLYFFREYEDKRGCEIMVSEYSKGKWNTPERLGPTINTGKHECDPFIDPGENYVIYCVRDRDGGYGNNDLYISFKTENGSWSKSFNLGAEINSKEEEITPYVSYDGNYLFFTSNRLGSYDIFWVNAKIIDQLKPD
jgi:Tol biopolymer transport system component